jgi:transcription initiation factor TFIIE subunit alpha
MDGKNSKPGDTQTIQTEIPSSLKQLARLVVRGFYSLEDALIVDMLVRYPCLREDDLSNLLKFDKKMLRAKVAGLRNDKFLMAKPRMETNEDNKVIYKLCKI